MSDNQLRELAHDFEDAYKTLTHRSIQGSRQGLSDLSQRVIELAEEIRERVPNDYINMPQVENSIAKIRRGDLTGTKYLGQVAARSRAYSY